VWGVKRKMHLKLSVFTGALKRKVLAESMRYASETPGFRGTEL
jgi:hypothetical protein